MVRASTATLFLTELLGLCTWIPYLQGLSWNGAGEIETNLFIY